MSVNLFWLHAGGCSGDTHSLLNADSPDLTEVIKLLDIHLLWHPSLSKISPDQYQELVKRLASGEEKLDILCIEGAVIQGPDGTGLFDTFMGNPKMDMIKALCERAEYVVAIGTCASFGGITAACEVEATGLQFLRRKKGGFLGNDFTSGSGLPVINLSGCPCHPGVVTGALTVLVQGRSLELNEYNMPDDWYGMMVHQGCTRNEYHEYRVEESSFGEKGCLFFHLGCQGPLTYGSCNKMLWNKKYSKTRVGVPCFGCTMPTFPGPDPFFQTSNIEGIPIKLPYGVDRAHYMAYKFMAAEAAPDRLKKRKTGV
ncbi:MAG: NADH:ubiquinone oxidoreductase [Desulfobacteraceae bacterium]|nr:NADH:ubiquinone oxidoreductase [Desulfobacteraceae bacterium]